MFCYKGQDGDVVYVLDKETLSPQRWYHVTDYRLSHFRRPKSSYSTLCELLYSHDEDRHKSALK
jgi:hypothetical protein